VDSLSFSTAEYRLAFTVIAVKMTDFFLSKGNVYALMRIMSLFTTVQCSLQGALVPLGQV
jgi:hypothetical protein